jgi:hypothetical protein
MAYDVMLVSSTEHEVDGVWVYADDVLPRVTDQITVENTRTAETCQATVTRLDKAGKFPIRATQIAGSL